MKFSNWKIGRKLAAAFGFLVLVTVVIGGLGVLELRTIEAARAQVSAETTALAGLREARFYMARQENSFRGYLISGDDYYLERLSAHHENFLGEMAKASEAYAAVPDAPAQIEAARTAAGTWFTIVDGAAKRIAAGEDRSIGTALVGNDGPSDKAMAAAEDAIDALVESAVAAREATNLHLTESVQRGSLYLMIGAVVSAIAAAIIGWLMTRAIAGPALNMVGYMRRLMAGDNDIQVPCATRKDEFGDMGVAVLAFRDAAVEKIRLEQDALTLRSQADGERAGNEAAQARLAEEQALIVSQTAAGLSALAAGDLAHRITADFPGEYARLKADFNNAMDKLEEAMGVIGSNAAAMQSGAGEISQAADDLSRRTEQQAATLEETAAALDEITATVKRTAEGAERAGTVVAGAKSAAENSGVVVGRAVAAMGEIERSSDQISQIIGVIDEIAFQTNLLALNAGVEAARAGDAGRGFAVVASEVRALAQRSAEAAKEIKGLIAASSGHVKDGVGLVGETGEALTAIVERVAEINGLMAEITASAQEQATALSQVNTAVNQMDQTTQQNAAMVEQSTAASHNLSQEAGELATLVGKFHVSDQGRGAAASGRGKPNPVRQAQARIEAFARQSAPAAHTPAPVQSPASQPRRAAAGGAALAQSAEPQWEQF